MIGCFMWRSSSQFVAGVLAVWLSCHAQVTAAAEKPQPNWTSTNEPCAKYADLRRPGLGGDRRQDRCHGALVGWISGSAQFLEYGARRELP